MAAGRVFAKTYPVWRHFDESAAPLDTPDSLPNEARLTAPRARGRRYELLLIPSAAAGIRNASADPHAPITDGSGSQTQPSLIQSTPSKTFSNRGPEGGAPDQQ
jgi:hypothetical protein